VRRNPSASRALENYPLDGKLNDVRLKNPGPVAALELDQHECSVGESVCTVDPGTEWHRAVRGELALRVDESRGAELRGKPGRIAGCEASLPACTH
jgi:hypothetical protein